MEQGAGSFPPVVREQLVERSVVQGAGSFPPGRRVRRVGVQFAVGLEQ